MIAVGIRMILSSMIIVLMLLLLRPRQPCDLALNHQSRLAPARAARLERARTQICTFARKQHVANALRLSA